MKNYLTTHIRSIRYFTNLLSIALVVLSIIVVGVKGLNLGLDFTGGVVSEVQLAQSTTQTELRETLSPVLGEGISVTKSGDEGRWTIRYSADRGDAVHQEFKQVLAKAYPDSSIVSDSIVGAQVGQDLYDQGGLALLVSLLSILGYLSFRFEWRLASGALAALLHDVVLVLGFFALTQMEFNLTVFAAILAILGYSLNDSIIIADRIREILKFKPHEETALVSDQAVLGTFARTMVTSGTTLMTVGALWFLGGDALQGFATAMFIGIFSGTWSSISMGTVLPEWLKLEGKHYQPVEIDSAP
ncbi:protein translocase subunit SecF [Vibrio sp. ZSDZ65]|uniref:Protein-export membrane protein SecF n=1 Tax=Vibrio qingdaonensis TaxID=2829491 RepID=A0A9X3CN79_9VIBR|nr:protein translocase subunit SecF [Vibrio qingdaonensis]MCW8346420.1 protein translocase subunit SecF [Vibrio qingdaonensis]